MALHLLHPLGLRLQYAVLPDFCVGAVDPNSGSHVCVTGALPTEPHPQAQTRFCCFFFNYLGVTSARTKDRIWLYGQIWPKDKKGIYTKDIYRKP